MSKKKNRLDEMTIAGGFAPTQAFGKFRTSKLSDLVAEDFYKEDDAPKYDMKEFVNEVGRYNEIGKSIYRETDLSEIAEKLSKMAEIARDHTLRETENNFDKITVNKNMKSLGNHAKEFSKIANEATSLQQRMESVFEDMGHILNRYYDINELNEEGAFFEKDDISKEKVKENDGKYQAFFKGAMKKFGVSSPDDLDDDKKKAFYNYIDKNYSAKNESKLPRMIKEAKLKMPKTAGEASDQAMDWQHEFSNKSMSWQEVLDAQMHFEKVAKKFKLTDEFKENGII